MPSKKRRRKTLTLVLCSGNLKYPHIIGYKIKPGAKTLGEQEDAGVPSEG